ncbi:DUF2232 domain-containing protein [Paenibacillus sediminis]|uniref:Uncharacterized protein YybS (DUF2232 family) n=1 Tax=Paenibacillus sediminis TaxID=664909 RepID=A0ABS4H6S8_9BACL|nr:DUF2232 domain-containing protein [Paenibacillus sediminis]MBP1938243.1 uncharacterized protein YybS (DUF2232 family) [Paenibacillus sediminis]
MKLRWTSLAWSAAYLLLLLSLGTPLTVITGLFLVLPAVVLYTTLSTKQFILHLVVIWLAAALIAGPVILLLSTYFLIPAIVMGRLYKKRAPALQTIMAGMVTILAESLIMLLIITTVYQVDLSGTIHDLFTNVVDMTSDPLSGVSGGGTLAGDFGWTPETTEQLSDLTVQMIPYGLIISSFFMAIITHAIARPAIESLGHSVPKLKPAKDWRLPRTIILYYFIGFIFELIAKDSDNHFVNMIAANLTPIINVCFSIQAIGFLFFIAHVRKWNSAIPVLLAIPLALLHPLLPVLRIIGILDLAFPMREMITRPRR